MIRFDSIRYFDSINKIATAKFSVASHIRPHISNQHSSHTRYPTYKLADTAVLELDVTEAIEALLVGVLQKAEGIVEAERGLDADCLCLRRNFRVKSIEY